MKTKLILLMALFISFISYSQSVYKSSIDSGGASISASDIQLLFTIGEVAVQETTNMNITISEGFIDSFISGALSINENFWNDNIVIYPNPTSRYINITSKAIIDSIEIYDIQGKKVLKIKNIDHVDMSKFPSGMYLVIVFSKEGYVTKKIVLK